MSIDNLSANFNEATVAQERLAALQRADMQFVHDWDMQRAEFALKLLRCSDVCGLAYDPAVAYLSCFFGVGRMVRANQESID